MARFISMAQSLFGSSSSGPRYSALPGEGGSSPRVGGSHVSEKAAAASAPKGHDDATTRMKVFASVSFYLVAALVMVMVNKWVLNAVPVPLFFLLVQLLTAIILLHASSLLGLFVIPDVRWSTIKGLVPLISVNCLGLAFNTYCLQFVDASFYQVARGLVLPFTAILSHFSLGQKTSMMVGSAIGLVCLGFIVGVSSENMSVSGLGILLGVCSSATTASHAIVVKQALPVVNGSAMDLAYYSNFLSAFIMGPAALLVEAGPVVDMIQKGGDEFHTFWVGALITGVFGFLICIAGFVSIKVTSPVTHMISSAVRGVIQTGLGVALFNDAVTKSRMSGIGLILGGSILYTFLKDKEMQQNNKMKQASSSYHPMASSSSQNANRSPPPEIVFDFADKNDRDVAEADAFLNQEDRRERRSS